MGCNSSRYVFAFSNGRDAAFLECGYSHFKDGVVPVSMLVMMAVVSFTLPITGLLLSLYAVKRCYKMVHFCLAALLALFCTVHSTELIFSFELQQLFIHPMLVILSITLVYEAWKWYKKV